MLTQRMVSYYSSVLFLFAFLGVSPITHAKCTPYATPQTYYVSPTGNDNSLGRINEPFRTIQKAANIARPGDTIILRGGTYRETVKPACSGTESQPITFTAYEGEEPVINGTNIVSNWNKYSGKLYQADMAWDLGQGNNQVFVNGQALIEAQWPDPTTDDFEKISNPEARSTVQKGTPPVYTGANELFTTTSYDNELKPPFLINGEKWNKAQIHIQTSNKSAFLFGKVTNLIPAVGDQAGAISYQVKGEGSDPNGSYNKKIYAAGGEKYYLTGLLSFLTTAGEWYLDTRHSKLYLRTLADKDPSTMLVEAKARQFAFDLTQRSYIVIKGIRLFATGITTNFSNNYPQSTHITIDSIKAQYVSHATALSSIWSGFNAGIQLRGINHQLKNSIITDAGNNAVTIYGDNIEVSNNIIHDANYDASTIDGAISMIGKNNLITNNTIYNAGYSLIYFLTCTGSKITNNLLFNGLLQLSDGGIIYTSGVDGGGTQIANNIVFNLHSNPRASGIYLDNDSTNFLINNNIVINAKTALVLNAPNKLSITAINTRAYNNTLVPYCSGCQAITSYTAAGKNVLTGVEIKNNIIHGKVSMNLNMKSPVALQPIYQNNFFGSQFSDGMVNYIKGSENNKNNLFSTVGDLNPEFISPYPNKEMHYGLQASSPAIALSQAIPSSFYIGPYEIIDFPAVAAGSPAGACQSPWRAGSNLVSTSQIGLCGQ